MRKFMGRPFFMGCFSAFTGNCPLFLFIHSGKALFTRSALIWHYAISLYCGNLALVLAKDPKPSANTLILAH
jgi:hypothetical protein